MATELVAVADRRKEKEVRRIRVMMATSTTGRSDDAPCVSHGECVCEFKDQDEEMACAFSTLGDARRRRNGANNE